MSVPSLVHAIAEMAATEDAVMGVLSSGVAFLQRHAQAAVTSREFERTARAHWEALRNRLTELSTDEEHTGKRPARFASPEDGGPFAVSGALRNLDAAFTWASLGYATLHVQAHRFLDLVTADLAEAHLRDYVKAAKLIDALISDVVVWELEQTGQECQCLCPSCGLGVCVCSPHGTHTLEQAWRETEGPSPERGVIVRPPRRGSAASRAGLRPGDRVVGVDDEAIGSFLDMQNAVRRHEPGQEVRLQVERAGGRMEEVVLTRPRPVQAP